MADAPGNGQQQQQVYPFRANTRQKTMSLPSSMSYSLGGQQTIQLGNTGYLSKVYLRFNGLITYSAGTTLAKFAPYSIFRNIQLDLNSGKQILCNCSGFDLFLLDSVRRKNGRLDQQTDSDFYTVPTSGTAQPFVVTLEIPVAVGEGVNFINGLINLQAPEIQCNLTVSFLNALTDLGTNITALSGTVDVVIEYYEIPDPQAVMQPYVMLHKIISQDVPILGTGETIFTVPRGGTIHRIIHTVELNGARSDSFDSVRVEFNTNEKVYNYPKWLIKDRARQLYGYNMPTGVAVLDWMAAYGIPEESDLRDTVNMDRLSTLQSIVTVTSGTTLGSNNNFLHTLREFTQIPAAGN